MITNKALYGIVGAGVATAIVGYLLLPADSKLKKSIGDKATWVRNLLMKNAGPVANDLAKKVTPVRVHSNK